MIRINKHIKIATIIINTFHKVIETLPKANNSLSMNKLSILYLRALFSLKSATYTCRINKNMYLMYYLDNNGHRVYTLKASIFHS